MNALLKMLLAQLLADEKTAGVKELSVHLAKLKLNAHSIGEVVRLCLRSRADADAATRLHTQKKPSDEQVKDDHERPVTPESSFASKSLLPRDVYDQLETVDFHNLPIGHKLYVLWALVESVIAAGSTIDDWMQHVDKKREEAAS